MHHTNSVQVYCQLDPAQTRHSGLLQRFVVDHNAETMQAVPNMLELVPRGGNKGSGMRKLLADLQLPVEVPPLSQNMLSDDRCLLQSVDVI